MTAPTVAELDRYIELLSESSVEPDDAVLAIWGMDEPDPAEARYRDALARGLSDHEAREEGWPTPAPKKAKKPTVMVTEFPDGVVIGWDTCAIGNRGCGKVVSRCECKDGPRELSVFAKWRSEASTMPDYGATRRAAQSVATPVVEVIAGLGDEPGRPSADDLPDSKLLPCVLGEHLVDPSYVDKNDDGTYSCFDCQEKGLQRGVQVDG